MLNGLGALGSFIVSPLSLDLQSFSDKIAVATPSIISHITRWEEGKGNLCIASFFTKENLPRTSTTDFLQTSLANILSHTHSANYMTGTGLPLLSYPRFTSWCQEHLSPVEHKAFGEHNQNFVRKEEESWMVIVWPNAWCHFW